MSLKIGIVFDREQDYPQIDGPADRFAEFEPESTILAMESAIQIIGAIPVRIGHVRNLLSTEKPDAVWNISEGYGTRNREAWAPVLCELLHIPFIGSDAHTLSVSLDKHLTKIIAKSIGIPVANGFIAAYEIPLQIPPNLPFPLFVKPRYEGTAKGISAKNVCQNATELETQIESLKKLYAQDILVESWIPGAEFTVAVAGTPLTALPVLERAIEKNTGIGLHALDGKSDHDLQWSVSHSLTPELENTLQKWSLELCHEMNILDFARFDFKLDHGGNPFFLEVNPLPTFGTDQTFGILAELSGTEYTAWLAEWLKAALRRIGLLKNR